MGNLSFVKLRPSLLGGADTSGGKRAIVDANGNGYCTAARSVVFLRLLAIL
jgi:hypothetical protein